jgi:hypothetical protein
MNVCIYVCVGASHSEASMHNSSSNAHWVRRRLVTTYKDVHLWQMSESQQCLHWDSLSGAQTATASLLAGTLSANGVIRLLMLGRTAGLQLPGHRCIEDRPTHGPFEGSQHLTGYCTHCMPACLPARLYSLLTAINICYRNLHGCLCMLPEPTSHICMYVSCPHTKIFIELYGDLFQELDSWKKAKQLCRER